MNDVWEVIRAWDWTVQTLASIGFCVALAGALVVEGWRRWRGR